MQGWPYQSCHHGPQALLIHVLNLRPCNILLYGGNLRNAATFDNPAEALLSKVSHFGRLPVISMLFKYVSVFEINKCKMTDWSHKSSITMLIHILVCVDSSCRLWPFRPKNTFSLNVAVTFRSVNTPSFHDFPIYLKNITLHNRVHLLAIFTYILLYHSGVAYPIRINIVILDLCDQSVILHLLISKTETYLNNIDITGKRPKCETFESNASAGLSKVAAFLRLPPYNNILQGRRFRKN